jgi:hypothetical protein
MIHDGYSSRPTRRRHVWLPVQSIYRSAFFLEFHLLRTFLIGSQAILAHNNRNDNCGEATDGAITGALALEPKLLPCPADWPAHARLIGAGSVCLIREEMHQRGAGSVCLTREEMPQRGLHQRQQNEWLSIHLSKV